MSVEPSLTILPSSRLYEGLLELSMYVEGALITDVRVYVNGVEYYVQPPEEATNEYYAQLDVYNLQFGTNWISGLLTTTLGEAEIETTVDLSPSDYPLPPTWPSNAAAQFQVIDHTLDTNPSVILSWAPANVSTATLAQVAYTLEWRDAENPNWPDPNDTTSTRRVSLLACTYTDTTATRKWRQYRLSAFDTNGFWVGMGQPDYLTRIFQVNVGPSLLTIDPNTIQLTQYGLHQIGISFTNPGYIKDFYIMRTDLGVTQATDPWRGEYVEGVFVPKCVSELVTPSIRPIEGALTNWRHVMSQAESGDPQELFLDTDAALTPNHTYQYRIVGADGATFLYAPSASGVEPVYASQSEQYFYSYDVNSDRWVLLDSSALTAKASYSLGHMLPQDLLLTTSTPYEETIPITEPPTPFYLTTPFLVGVSVIVIGILAYMYQFFSRTPRSVHQPEHEPPEYQPPYPPEYQLQYTYQPFGAPY